MNAMMTRKQICFSLSVALTATVAHTKPVAHVKEKWNSVYTDLTKDCVTIEKSTDKAEIDFEDRECKAFGGYQLNIGGGDLRY